MRRFVETGEGLRLGERREIRSVRADGTEFPVAITTSAVADAAGWTFHAFIEDLSDRVEAEGERAGLIARLEEARQSVETRFTGVVDSLAEAVTIRDPDDRILYANRAALESMGFASVEEMRESPPNAIMSDYIVRGEDGLELRMEDIPSVRLLRGDAAPPLLMNTVHRSLGRSTGACSRRPVCATRRAGSRRRSRSSRT